MSSMIGKKNQVLASLYFAEICLTHDLTNITPLLMLFWEGRLKFKINYK